MTKRQGLALVEILVAAIVTGVIVTSISTAFAIIVRHEQSFSLPRKNFESSIYFENQVRSLLQKATYDSNDGGYTFFEGTSISGDASTSDTLRFTVSGLSVLGPAFESTETDFETRNESFGPIGGATEVGLSMTPVGQAGSATGIFIRKQTPSDTDPEQGGYESVLDVDIASINFEFWDSTAWIATWDSSVEGSLPTAVRVTYSRASDPDAEKSFVVTIPTGQGVTQQ